MSLLNSFRKNFILFDLFGSLNQNSSLQNAGHRGFSLLWFPYGVTDWYILSCLQMGTYAVNSILRCLLVCVYDNCLPFLSSWPPSRWRFRCPSSLKFVSPSRLFTGFVSHESIAECLIVFIRFLSIQSANRDLPRHLFNFDDDDKEVKSQEPTTKSNRNADKTVSILIESRSLCGIGSICNWFDE